jgi:phosphoglycolate phosphatase
MKRRLAVLARDYVDPPVPLSGLPALELLESWVGRARQRSHAAALEFEERARMLIVDMEMESARRGSLFPFTRPLFDELRHKKIKVAIITRNCEKAVRLVFPDMNQYCSSFLARDHVPRVKPDPDHLLRALANVSASCAGSLMVGDHPLDVQTGKRAGVLTAGVWSGSATRADLVLSGAHWTARNCEELIRLLEVRGLI